MVLSFSVVSPSEEIMSRCSGWEGGEWMKGEFRAAWRLYGRVMRLLGIHGCIQRRVDSEVYLVAVYEGDMRSYKESLDLLPNISMSTHRSLFFDSY